MTTLINLIDQDATRQIAKEDFISCTSVLGYDCTDSAWDRLMSRFGAVKGAAGDQSNESASPLLDISLVGDHFTARYDDVLEEVLRRLVGGMATLASRVSSLERNVHYKDEVTRAQKQETILRRWKNKLLSLTFEAWSRKAKEQRALLLRVTGHWRNSFVATVWRQWIEVVAEAKHHREVMAKVAGRMRNRIAAMSFGVWKEMYEEVQASKAKAAGMLSRWLNGQLALTFTSWREAIATVQYHRRLLTQVAGRMRMRLAASSFGRWRAMVEEAAYHRQVMAQVAGRMLNRLASMAFTIWQDWVVETVTARNEALRRVANRIGNRALTLAFDTWVEQIDEKKRKMANARHLAARMLNALTGKCFDGWVTYVEEKHRILRRAAYAIGPGRLVYMVFQTWAEAWREATAEREQQSLTGSIDARMAAYLDELLGAKMVDFDRMFESVMQFETKLENLPLEMAEKMRLLEEQKDLEIKEARANRILRRWLHKAINGCFDEWVRLYKRHISHAGRVRVSQAWALWSDLAREYGRQMRIMRTVIGRISNGILAKIMASWLEIAIANEPRRKARALRDEQDILISELDGVGARWFDVMMKQQAKAVVEQNAFDAARGKTKTAAAAAAASTAAAASSPRASRSPSFKTGGGGSTAGDVLTVAGEAAAPAPRTGAEEAHGPGGVEEQDEAAGGGLLKPKQGKSLLTALDSRYMQLRTGDLLSQARVKEVIQQQQTVLSHLGTLNEQNQFLRSILKNVITDPSALSSLEKVARTAQTKASKDAAARPLHESQWTESQIAVRVSRNSSEPGMGAFFAGDPASQQQAERILAGAAAKGMGKSKSIPSLGGAAIVPGVGALAKKPLPPVLPVEDV